MTPRSALARYIAQVGIVEAGVKLRRHVIGLERMVNGIDPVPEEVARRLNSQTEGSTP